MKDKHDRTRNLDLLKGHFAVLIIKTQEEADRARAECLTAEARSDDAEKVAACRERWESLRRRVDCYIEKYELVKRRNAGSIMRSDEPEPGDVESSDTCTWPA